MIAEYDNHYLCNGNPCIWKDGLYIEMEPWLFVLQKVRTIQCNLCGRYFNQRQHLKVHMEGVHSNKRNHKCPLCGKSYGRNGTLRRHVAQVHKGDPDVVLGNGGSQDVVLGKLEVVGSEGDPDAVAGNDEEEAESWEVTAYPVDLEPAGN